MNATKFINVSLELFGVFLSLMIILSLILTGSEKTELNRRFFKLLSCNILLLLSDSTAWIVKGFPSEFSFYTVRISNFLVFALGYVMMAVSAEYLLCYVNRKVKVSAYPLIRLMRGITVIAIVLVIISQFNHMYYKIDEQNLYVRQNLFWLSQVWAIIGMTVDGMIIWLHRKNLSRIDLITQFSYVVLPVTAMVIQIFTYGVALLYLATSISMVCCYMGLQVEQAKIYRARELELERSRTDIMLSQIQPHFLFNSLTSIRYLCSVDPQQAEDALFNFSNFLRGNIESLNSVDLIPFQQELTHLNNYLAIEKIRYEDKLKIVYDIQSENFLLPSLTIQPLVENAVRYGIGSKPGGGTVTISSRETQEEFLISVSDDGNGFDPDRIGEDGKTHIGIQNVGKRIVQQCGGKLHIDTALGKGTCVTLSIPKKGL